MSRLAKKTIPIPSGVTVSVAANGVSVNGPKGAHLLPILAGVVVEIVKDDAGANVVSVRPVEGNPNKANVGTMWSLTRNAIQGSAQGFEKVLEIQGVGFKAALEGKTLVLSLGFVNPVRFTPLDDVSIAVEKNLIKVSGHDKHHVGQAASKIRSLKKPEPYKGKGIRYQGEVIRMKAGKKAATAGK